MTSARQYDSMIPKGEEGEEGMYAGNIKTILLQFQEEGPVLSTEYSHLGVYRDNHSFCDLSRNTLSLSWCSLNTVPV